MHSFSTPLCYQLNLYIIWLFTFTLVAIFLQFKTLLTRTFITSWGICTNLIAPIKFFSWITFIDIYREKSTTALVGASILYFNVSSNISLSVGISHKLSKRYQFYFFVTREASESKAGLLHHMRCGKRVYKYNLNNFITCLTLKRLLKILPLVLVPKKTLRTIYH